MRKYIVKLACVWQRLLHTLLGGGVTLEMGETIHHCDWCGAYMDASRPAFVKVAHADLTVSRFDTWDCYSSWQQIRRERAA